VSPPSGTVSPSAPTSPSTSAPPAAAAPAVLTSGMSGPAVLQLQQRLAALTYYPGPEDGQFGADTLEAVWAFQETQGLPTTGTVGAATQAALANPGNPAVLVPDGGATRVEVNLSDEVLVLYQAGQVALVSHVSSGGGYYFCTTGGCGYAVTPTGDFHTISFMPGWITVPLGEMYNPVFFIGSAFAIHGDTYVPLQPVSHGCVRIPMDVAAFFHTLVPTPGTPVYVRQ
jgi:lipoprotein-anchoring transpeptidase ErfK/SrfK